MTLARPFPIQAGGVTFGADPMYRLLDHLLGEGVIGPTDLQVIQNPAGANLSVTVGPGDGYVLVDATNGGKRQIHNDANSNSGTPGSPNATDWLATFTTPHASLPRIDRVIAKVRDSNVDGGSTAYDAKFQVLAGTATSGATLANLTGAPAVPANALLLGNVLVPAAATQILTANIDTAFKGRPRALLGAGGVLSRPDVQCSMFLAANQTVGSGETQSLWASINETLAGMGDAANNRIVIPVAGLYEISVGADYPDFGSAATYSGVNIKINSSSIGIFVSPNAVTGYNGQKRFGRAYASLGVGDYINTNFVQNSGANQQVFATGFSHLSARLIG